MSACFPNAKKVFAHPFVTNPEAQLSKHRIEDNASAKEYNYFSVGKVFLSYNKGSFKYFSPYDAAFEAVLGYDLVESILADNGTALIYVSKASIYDRSFVEKFSNYLNLCDYVRDPLALEIIESLRTYIGASSDDNEFEKHSMLISMMEKGTVIHHGSIPLKARLLIEKFIKMGFARICFATSTLSQGVNMPFDVVWIDNFYKMQPLELKNLLGRAGRTTNYIDKFDYGYTIINSKNVKTFIERVEKVVSIKTSSYLDEENIVSNPDYEDIVVAVKGNTYNDDYHLPQSQVDRLDNDVVFDSLRFILDNLFIDNCIITGTEYQKIKKNLREKIKRSFKNIFVSHMKRDYLTRAESGVVSTSIPILLWRVQGKSFSEMVSLRYSYLSRKSEVNKIKRKYKDGEISKDELDDELKELKVKPSPAAFSIPQVGHKHIPLFSNRTSVVELDYDRIVYDTYDYLDKVVSLSLADPISAALDIYYNKFNDDRSIVLKNYVKYGTNDDVEILLIRYGFDPEDFVWLIEHIDEIDETAIVFKESVLNEPFERLMIIDRYL